MNIMSVFVGNFVKKFVKNNIEFIFNSFVHNYDFNDFLIF